jgi:hypothetical protein
MSDELTKAQKARLEYEELRDEIVVEVDAPPDREIVEAVVGILKAENARLRTACTAAMNALRSYQYGNGSPDLAEEIAEHLAEVLGKKP